MSLVVIAVTTIAITIHVSDWVTGIAGVTFILAFRFGVRLHDDVILAWESGLAFMAEIGTVWLAEIYVMLPPFSPLLLTALALCIATVGTYQGFCSVGVAGSIAIFTILFKVHLDNRKQTRKHEH